MKKIVVCSALLFFFATFFVIGRKLEAKNTEAPFVQSRKTITTEIRSIYISYIELEKYFKGKTEEEAKEMVHEMIQNSKQLGINQIILQVRAFSDAIYPSKIYPMSLHLVEKETDSYPFDLLAYFIQVAHQNKMTLHAWINPYRIRSTTDYSTITEKNPAFRYLQTRVAQKIEGKGVYYNPAKEESLDLILEGIKEIITNYDVDGIHFDDYFYPSDEIDTEEYQEYVEQGGTLSIEDYRFSCILKMIQSVYRTIKEENPNILFGIAPDGNLENNEQIHFLDVSKILKEKGYIDYIMPQLYYGFWNETKPFIETLSVWNSLIQNKDITLQPALAFYKTGMEDAYAKSGSKEWIEHSDIIKKQILTSRNVSYYSGFCFFRYDSLFQENLNSVSKQELENVKSLLN